MDFDLDFLLDFLSDFADDFLGWGEGDRTLVQCRSFMSFIISLSRFFSVFKFKLCRKIAEIHAISRLPA